jgi:WD40 repeat protein
MRIALCLLAAGLVCWLPATVRSAADNARTHLEAGPYGPSVIESRSLGHDSRTRAYEIATFNARRSGEIIWHNTFSDAICQTTSISTPTAHLLAGTWLNPPQEAEWIALEGDGTPDWVHSGTDFRVAAARNGDVLAGVDKLPGGLTLYKWHPGSATPDWSYEIPSATVMGARALVVSPDGLTIALVVTMQDPQFVRLYCFDPGSPVPVAIYDAPGEHTSGNIDITADGRYVAFYSGATAYVFDRQIVGLRWSGSMGAGNAPLAISGDGAYLAYGWTTLYVRVWNGSAYELLWSAPGGSFWLRSCRFSLDASTLAVGWYQYSTHLQNKIELFEMPASSPLWTYTYPMGAGVYQDIPYEIAATHDGGYIAVGSWGDEANTNPEVHVFEHAVAEPVMTLDTPGSIFGIDIVEEARGTVYVSACGKHIHANENGRGGDLYCLRLTAPAAVGNGDAVPEGPMVQAAPNPFTKTTTASFAVPISGSSRLSVYSATGRLVRLLTCKAPEGATGSLTWDGRTQDGHLAAPGVYFLRLEAEHRSAARRVVKIK